MTTPPEPDTKRASSKPGALVRIVWSVAALYVAVLILGGTAAYLTALPSVCKSCHEIEPSVATWQTSAHARVGCPACHEPVRPLYLFPETFVFRAQMLRRDVIAHRADPTASTLPTSVVGLRPI